MNILAFLNSYSEGLSGGDVCFLNFAKHVGKKNKLVIVTSSLGKTLCQNEGVKAVFRLTTTEKTFSNVILTYLVRTYKALFVRISSEKTVLYSSSDFLPDVFPAFIIKRKNSKHIWIQKIFHLIPKERVIPHLFQKISLFLARSANLVIVDNEKLKRKLQKYYGLPSGKIEVIPPGANIKCIKKIKPHKQIFDALFIGQLRRSKGVFDIPNIWEKVIKEYPKAKIAIIGKNIGNNQLILKKIIQQKKLTNNIELLEYLSNEEKYSFLKSAKCLILPSFEEGFGMVVLESLVCGTPVIAYDLPVFREYFPKTVNTVPIGKIIPFSKAVIEKIRFNAKENYRNIYEKFDIEKLVKREYRYIKKLYEKKTTC